MDRVGGWGGFLFFLLDSKALEEWIVIGWCRVEKETRSNLCYLLLSKWVVPSSSCFPRLGRRSLTTLAPAPGLGAMLKMKNFQGSGNVMSLTAEDFSGATYRPRKFFFLFTWFCFSGDF